MKRSIILTFVLLAAISGFAFPQSNDRVLIRQVIDEATRHFGQSDFESWSSYWVQAPEALLIYTERAGVRKYTGWKEIEPSIKDAMPAQPLGDDLILERTNFRYEISKNIAWVYFDQHDNLSGTLTYKMETRVLRKINGKWKIMLASVIETTSFAD